MSCYHPFVASKTGRLTENGKFEYVITGTLETRRDLKEIALSPDEILIPCGKCLGCRLDYSRTWADRMMLELDHSKKAIFLTLTYNEEHVPVIEADVNGNSYGYTLFKRDLQLFFKRLRKYFDDKEIRYYAVGEYGKQPRNGFFPRPHYHAIIFGLGLEDLGKIKVHKFNKLKQPVYESDIINRIWSIREVRKVPKVGKKGQLLKSYDKEVFYDPIGFASVCNVSWETCAYVARYVQKKVFHGLVGFFEYLGCSPEFSVMSRNPGIGSYYPVDHPDVWNYVNIHLSGKKDAISLPRYLIEKLDQVPVSENNPCFFNPDLYNKIKEERKKFANDKMLNKMQQTDLPWIEQLENEENEKFQKVGVLTRELE